VWIGTRDGVGVTWAVGPSLPDAIEHPAFGRAGGRLWFLGGDEEEGLRSDVFSAEVDGTAVGPWTEGPPLDTAFTWAASATVSDHLFVFGGTADFDEAPRTDVSRLDAGAGGSYTLVPQTPLPEGRFAAAATTADGFVYVVGGATSFYDAADTVWRAPVVDDVIGDWEELAVLDDPLVVPGLTVTGDTLLVAGGASNWVTEEARVWQISLADGNVTRAPKLPEPRLGQGSARLDDLWVMVGGWSDLSGVMHATAAVTTLCPG
jgi:hypothetical protein